MKTTNQRWTIWLALLLTAGATARAVNPDINGTNCWRGLTAATRQMWTFDSNANPIVPSVKVNQPGNPLATLTLGNLGQGWSYNTCSNGQNGCGPVITAVLPLITAGFDTNSDPNPANWDQGPPYETLQGLTPPYTDPSTLGDVQGYWDMGGSGNRVTLTIPNSGAPAGTLRYFLIQGTYNVSSGVAAVPGGYAVTNSAGVGTAVKLSTATTTMEQPLDSSGALSPNQWKNHKVLIRIPADTAAGNDTLTITNPSAFWVDAVVVETLDRVAVADTVSTAVNTATNIPFAQLLGNDRGGNLITVGTAVNGTVATNAGSIVTFTPNNGFSGTASFWYTNRDCVGYTNLGAQVTVTVIAANNPPVANPDNYTRPKGASLKIKISDLLTNDTDLDNNPITLAGINLTTTNGVHLSTNGNLISYTNSVTPDVNDQFTYTISDGQGGTATGTVSITVVGGTSGQAGGSLTVSGGQVSLVFHGIPSGVYQVQRSTNAGANWNTFSTNTANTGNPVGQINVTDTFNGVVPIPASAMYRLFLP